MRIGAGTLFSCIVAAVGVAAGLVAACGSAGLGFYAASNPSFDDGGPPQLGEDGSTPTIDGGIVVPGEASTPPPGGSGPTSLLAVHASANLYDFRLCFGLDDGGVLPVPAYPDDPAAPMPETNYPGVPVGGAVLLPAVQLADTTITPYVIRAQNLQKYGDVSTNPGQATCDQLICAGASCLTLNSDYVALPAVTLPSLGGTLVLAIEGCLAEGVAAGSTAQCGATYSAATGNLTAFAGGLAAADDAGVLTMQLTQLSPSFDQGATAALTYVDPTIDASLSLTVPAASVGAPMTLPLSDAGALAAYFVMNLAPTTNVTQSLAAIQYFQAPSSDPFTYFSAPSTYFVAIVGDATDAAAPASLPDGAANPAFDGHGLHVIAYPENGP